MLYFEKWVSFGAKITIFIIPVTLYAAKPSSPSKPSSTPAPVKSSAKVAEKTPVATPSAAPSVAPSALPSKPAAPADPKSLLKEFTRAQSSELKALEHRNRFELKELKASQEARLKEWEKAEKEARYKFFDNHQKGPDRRTYIQDFIKRRDVFRKQLIEERAQKSRDQDTSVSKLKEEQAAKLKSFKQALDDGTTPSADLWPRVGR